MVFFLRSHGLPTATAAASSCVVRLCRRMESWRAWNQGSNSPCDSWNLLSYDILWSPMHTSASFQHDSPCKASCVDSDWAVSCPPFVVLHLVDLVAACASNCEDTVSVAPPKHQHNGSAKKTETKLKRANDMQTTITQTYCMAPHRTAH